MRISTFQIYQQSVNSMLEQQTTLAKTQAQMSTGKKILTPSDDPAASTRILELGQLIDMNTQFQRNADAAETRLVLEDSILAQSSDLLHRVRELAVQGLNDTNNPDDRIALSFEVRELTEELLQIANSRDSNGEYIFAGYQGSVEPFTDDGGGNYSYHGDQGQRILQIGPTRKVASSDAGDALFMRIDDGAGGLTDMFSVVNDLANDLAADTPMQATLTQLDSALNSVLTTRASIGARLNSVDSQRATNDNFDIQLRENRSSLEDLDYADAVSRFERQTLALQATQQTFIQIEGLSLFNYL